MKVRATILCLLALALAQVPWIPCHCGEGCAIRPVLVAETHDCADPDHGWLHDTCPAHGCTGHRERDEGQPEVPPVPDHHHDIYILQAVASASAPTLPNVVAALFWMAPADDLLAMVPPARAPRCDRAPGATGPPAALATVRLLL